MSPVIRRSISNVTTDLKKAVCFGDHFLKILKFFVSLSDVLNSKSLRKVETCILYVNGYKNVISQ